MTFIQTEKKKVFTANLNKFHKTFLCFGLEYILIIKLGIVAKGFVMTSGGKEVK